MDPCYDLIDDYDLIVSSFQAQYGLRLSKEIHEMPWREFKQLLTGIGPDTPLGRIVAIRREEDKDVLKNFTPDQRRIRAEWRNRRAKMVTQAQVDDIAEQLKQAFIKMAEGWEDGRR